MIRDPSDGTVKEINPEANKINAVAPKHAPKGIGPDTGVRQPTKTDAMQRLEFSREWLKNYHAKKEREHGGDLVSGADGGDGDNRASAPK